MKNRRTAKRESRIAIDSFLIGQKTIVDANAIADAIANRCDTGITPPHITRRFKSGASQYALRQRLAFEFQNIY